MSYYLNLNQAVKRNIIRFPSDFMFQLTNEEFENLISQSVTSRAFPVFIIEGYNRKGGRLK